MSPGLVLLPLQTSIPQQRELWGCSRRQGDSPPSNDFLASGEKGTRKGAGQALQSLPQSQGVPRGLLRAGCGEVSLVVRAAGGVTLLGGTWLLPSPLLRTSLRCGGDPALSPLGAFAVGSAESSVAIGNGDVTGSRRSFSHPLN